MATNNLGLERLNKTICIKCKQVLCKISGWGYFNACFSGSNQIPEVTAMKYCNGLVLGVGTNTGHVCDIQICKYIEHNIYNC